MKALIVTDKDFAVLESMLRANEEEDQKALAYVLFVRGLRRRLRNHGQEVKT